MTGEAVDLVRARLAAADAAAAAATAAASRLAAPPRRLEGARPPSPPPERRPDPGFDARAAVAALKGGRALCLAGG